MSASADVLAMAKVEVDLAAIPEGKNVRTFFMTGIETQRLTILPRFSSNGVENQSSSVTVLPTRLRRPRISRLSRYVTPKRMPTVSRSQSGWS
jgi:hypothetical protein